MTVFTKGELENIYRNNSNDEAAEKLGISVPTMIRLLKKNGIELKGAGAHNHEPKIKVVD